MAVLITGGAGFVGLNVAENLLARGADVILFGPSAPPPAALTSLERHPGQLSLAHGDVSVAADLDTVFGSHAIDRVVHGAAITADLAREKRAARDIFTVNLLGTVELLEAALRHGVSRVVQLGTGSIFGAAGTASAMLDEQTSPAVPLTMYGISKYAAERTAVRYRSSRGLNLAVARLGVVFGRWEYDTGMRDTLSLPLQLFNIAEAGGSAVVHKGAGDDWVYATDVTSGIVGLLDRHDTPEPIYHLSAGMRWSLAGWCQHLKQRFPAFRYEFAEALERCTVGQSASTSRAPMSIERLKRDTGYQPKFHLDNAFEDFFNWRARFPSFGRPDGASLAQGKRHCPPIR
jgi:nucleoside-diphosphate-sugar epimerase